MRSTNGADGIYKTIPHFPQWYKFTSPGKGECQDSPDAVLFLSLAFWFLSSKCWQPRQSFMCNTLLCMGMTLAGWGDTIHTWGTCRCPPCQSPGRHSPGEVAPGHTGSGCPVLPWLSTAAKAQPRDSPAESSGWWQQLWMERLIRNKTELKLSIC